MYRIVDNQYRHNGHGQGNKYLPKNGPLRSAVYLGRFIQAVGNGGQKSSGHNDIVGRGPRGQHNGPARIIKSDSVDQQIHGHQRPRKKHGEGKKEGELSAQKELPPGQGIGRHHGKKGADGRAHHSVPYGVIIGTPDFLVAEYHLVGFQGKAFGQQLHQIGYNRLRRADGHTEHIDQRIQCDAGRQKAEYIIAGCENPVPRGHSAALWAKLRCFLFPSHHRDTSETFLLSLLAKITSSRLMAELNSPTADPKL